MQKEERYWYLRQSKRSLCDNEENLQFFRDILLDIAITLLPKFKKIRFGYHCGKNYREWRLEIEMLREKLLSTGGIEGLAKLEENERELEEWRRTESNKIINEEIIPIVEEHTGHFLATLFEAEAFISEFVDTFRLKDQTERIVIYNVCAKIYEILLTFEILTHEEKVSYHSMSKLKTFQTIESLKNMGSSGRRRSSLQTKKSARLSITPTTPKIENLLARIGPPCTNLNIYLGH
jgi:hypothetical protein